MEKLESNLLRDSGQLGSKNGTPGRRSVSRLYGKFQRRSLEYSNCKVDKQSCNRCN